MLDQGFDVRPVALVKANRQEIARQLDHNLGSTGKYIRDYERVKLLLKKRLPADHIGQILQMQPNVVRAYVDLVYQYHPDLMPEMSPPSP